MEWNLLKQEPYAVEHGRICISLHLLCAPQNLHCLARSLFLAWQAITVSLSLCLLKTLHSFPGGSCFSPCNAVAGVEPNIPSTVNHCNITASHPGYAYAGTTIMPCGYALSISLPPLLWIEVVVYLDSFSIFKSQGCQHCYGCADFTVMLQRGGVYLSAVTTLEAFPTMKGQYRLRSPSRKGLVQSCGLLLNSHSPPLVASGSLSRGGS
jgi:hypothetical protein